MTACLGGISLRGHTDFPSNNFVFFLQEYGRMFSLKDPNSDDGKSADRLLYRECLGVNLARLCLGVNLARLA